MAQIVLGLGSSHGPTIQSTPDEWAKLGQKDTRDRRFDYQALLREARPDMADELSPERQWARHEANQAGLQTLAGIMAEANLDVIVTVSNPHRTWADDNQPVFSVFRGDPLPVPDPHGERRDYDKVFQPGAEEYRPQRETIDRPGQPDLATHLIRALIEDGFDVGCTDQLRTDAALDEAFTLLYERFTPDGQVPMVPFMLSRYLPNQATPGRCIALGRALRKAVESWPENKRVGLMASGGLSHQIIDEDLDRTVIDALLEFDEATLSKIDVARLNRSGGTPEILNWLTVGAAMEPLGMTLVGYQPCYRSPAGTGHGVTFGYWR